MSAAGHNPVCLNQRNKFGTTTWDNTNKQKALQVSVSAACAALAACKEKYSKQSALE